MSEKTLVVVLGETRASRLTFGGFKIHLLDVFNADLALCVAANEREDKSNAFYTHAKHIWTCQEYADWGMGLDELRPDLHPKWRSCDLVPSHWLGGIKTLNSQPGSGGIQIFFRAFLHRKLQDSGVLNEYDRFIITRSDFLYEVPHPPPHLLPNDAIWIPDGEHYGGYTDRHIVCPAQHVLAGLSVADVFTEKPATVVARMNSEAHNDWNIERLLKDHFRRTGLSRLVRMMPYVMFTVREEGGHTSWQPGKLDKQRGYYIKYSTEYQLAQMTEKLLAGSGWTREAFSGWSPHSDQVTAQSEPEKEPRGLWQKIKNHLAR